MNEKQKKTLMLGCGVGCGVLIVVAAAIIVAAVVVFPRFMATKAPQIAQKVQSDYASLKAAGQVPADSVSEYDALLLLADPSKSSYMGLSLIKVAFESHLADGKVSAEEKAEAVALTEFLKANPGAGYMRLREFVKKHPELEAAMSRLDPTSLGL